ncbi:hypothetical protein C1H46_043148 [Malus baccata]|uniref:Cleavage/polyadenylation specificity factor A subunit N-terminal domain-containing protein n=1 Tax=Malus baccata TaxID=106549 RepID=A0A540KAP9_MALBA|nr:hypothetical protein C1H46_043148 [Malus baccata]
MVVVQASKLSLPNPSLSSPPQITSLQFEPHSLSLALMHSDSTFSLYPSLSSPLSLSSLPPSQTLVAPPSSSSTFLLLQNPDPNPNTRTLFIASGPHRGGSQVLLRFYILQNQKQFVRAQVICTQKGIKFDGKLGVLVDAHHGVSIKLAGSVNFFAMYSVSSSKISVFSVKAIGDGDNGDDEAVVKLMRCAVIECCKLVWSISISFGVLILGEDNGVRVFNLRQLVKGRVRKAKTLSSSLENEGRNLGFPNGVVGDHVHSDLGDCGNKQGGDKCGSVEGSSEMTCSGNLCGKNDRNYVSVKQRSVKLKQDSCEEGVFFVEFKGKEFETSKSKRVIPTKALSIEALSPNKFLVLDSDGGLRILHLSSPIIGLEITSCVQQLPHIMKVQKLAVLPDIDSRTQSVWASDGYNSVQMLLASHMDIAENEKNNSEEKLIHVSVLLTIFASERIQDLIPMAANAILILGQGVLGSLISMVLALFMLPKSGAAVFPFTLRKDAGLARVRSSNPIFYKSLAAACSLPLPWLLMVASTVLALEE